MVFNFEIFVTNQTGSKQTICCFVRFGCEYFKFIVRVHNFRDFMYMFWSFVFNVFILRCGVICTPFAIICKVLQVMQTVYKICICKLFNRCQVLLYTWYIAVVRYYTNNSNLKFKTIHEFAQCWHNWFCFFVSVSHI